VVVEAWSEPYEAPTSLDAARVLGTHRRRPTLWTLAGIAGVLVCLGPSLAVNIVWPELLESRWSIVIYGLMAMSVPWALTSYAFATDWGQRPLEYWLRAWWRSRRLPRVMDGAALAEHHVHVRAVDHHLEDADAHVGAVVEVDPINLRLADAETLASHIKKLHAWYVGLKWPVQIVVRAWKQPDGLIKRRWFVAVQAPNPELLEGRLADVVAGLQRAGLGGHALNGDLYTALQACWLSKPPTDRLGPREIKRARGYATVDGELVRGFVLATLPRIVEPNWLAPLIDGDLPVDMSLWLDPIDNVDELEGLSARINEWETAQVLYVNRSGYRDPDIDDYIRDAKRTREHLKRPGMLRVFRAVVGVAVRGPDLATIGTLERQVIDQLREHIGPGPVIPLDWEQDRAPLIGVPTGLPPAYKPIRVTTPVLARSHPFSNSSLSMAGGVPCGTSKGSQREVSLNVWALMNPHMAILATSGAGKGYWLKIYLLRMMLADPTRRVWIIQAEKDEYTALAEAMPADKYEHPDLADWPRGAVIRIDALADLDRQLWWYRPSRMLHGQQLTVYDLTHMPPADRGKAIAGILTALEQQAEHEHRETLGHVVVDELGIVLRSPEAAQAIETAYRRFRSIPHLENPRQVSRRGMIGVSQRPSDLLKVQDGPGNVIASLSETHIYLRQKSTELKVTKAALSLTPDEADYLELAGDGDALLVAGRARVGLHLYATPDEHSVAKT
jgi:hypothetical protein